MSKKRKVKQSVVVQTTPELAFKAVTAASELREWFCDGAWTEVRPGGRYGLHWDQGYHVEGKFVKVEPPRRAVVTWWGSGEPGETRVKFRVKPSDEGVKVTVVHSGFSSGKKWDRAVQEAEKGWSVGLENLKSVLETGKDLRITRQPFLGIYLDLLDAERAAREGIAVEQGIYIGGAVEGSGAQAAGLKQGDVMVALGGVQTFGFGDVGTALRAHRAGDTVELELVRGQERQTVQVTLGSRPLEDVPDTATEMAQRLTEGYAKTDAALKAAVEGLTEAEAEQRPLEGEWSVRQTLVHLSIVERDYQFIFASVALDGWIDDGPSNQTAMLERLDAAVDATPTIPALLDRYFADERETAALLRRLPEEAVAHKARLFRIGQMALGLPEHTREHIEQIKRVIEAVRSE